ncbi:MAG: CBS domain-containing protein [Myxococcota bacterium]
MFRGPRPGRKSMRSRRFALASRRNRRLGSNPTARLGGDMQVSARMTRRPVTVSPDATLRHACDLMAKNDVRHVPVVKSRALVGIITERDVMSATARPTGAAAALDRFVSDYMTSSVITVSPDTDVERAARIFRKHHIAGLPVLRGNRLVGIITESDVLDALIEVAGHNTRRARIEFTIPRKPEHFHHICDLIKERGGQLLRAERHLRLNDRGLDVVLQVAAPAFDRVLEALEGAGYEIDLVVYQS